MSGCQRSSEWVLVAINSRRMGWSPRLPGNHQNSSSDTEFGDAIADEMPPQRWATVGFEFCHTTIIGNFRIIISNLDDDGMKRCWVSCSVRFKAFHINPCFQDWQEKHGDFKH